MKQASSPARRAAWLLLTAPVLLAIPAHAQDAAIPPPPVQPTLTPLPTNAGEAVPRGVDPNSRTTIAPGAADVIDDARIAAQAERRAAAPVREARRAPVARNAAPVAATPAAPAPAPAAPAETAATPAPQAAAPAAPGEAPAQTAPGEVTATDGGTPLWPLAAVVALILAAGAFFLLRRRRGDDAAEEVYHEEPVVEAAPAPVAERAPIAAAAAVPAAVEADRDEPVATALSDDATVSDAPAEDVAALTDAAPPVQDRPWLELAMRPVRAGTSADEALVEIELTVANSGSVPAEDVRVSTFMLTDTHASEMERMLVDAPADAAIDPVTIAPGEGTRIDATLAALKADLGADGRFTPVVVADARYRLPDGTEGRTSASFLIGVSDADGDTLIPIDLADRVMREDVEARLHGAPEHA